MPSKPGDWKPGDEAKADRLNEWAEYSTGVPFTVGGGIAYGGGSLARQGRGWILAKLSGASSPYSFTSQVDGGTGSLVNGPTTGTTSAYEVNGVSGLANKVVRLYPDGHGKFNFQYLACCGSGCSTGSHTINVKGCNSSNKSGASVSVTGPGGFSTSGTTDGSGNFTFSYVGYPAGSYSYSVSATRYNTATGSVTLSCGGSGTTNLTLTAASGYVCSACCNDPIATTLSFTTPYGTTITLTYSAGSWTGTSVESITCQDDFGLQTPGTVTFNWTMTAASCGPRAPATACNLEVVCDGASPFPCNPLQSGSMELGPSGIASSTCSPFSFTINYLYSRSGMATPGSGTGTLTE